MKNEVTIRLQGGLANYMFQIACAYAYALKYDKKLVLTTDNAIVGHKKIETYKNNIFSKLEFVTGKNFQKFTIYNEPTFHYQEIPFIEGDVYLNGYFQSEQYFKQFEKEIRELFEFEETKTIEIDKDVCSIHVRRGDYLTLPNHHPAISLNYIMKSVRQFPEDYKFIVFSDDIDWCKNNLMGDKFIYPDSHSDVNDFYNMSKCANNIIANSSFSWWAAWLNKNPDKKVIAPIKWFGSAYNHNTKDLIPENWIKI